MKKYYWNLNESDEIWYEWESTIDYCIECAKEMSENEGIYQDTVFIGESYDYVPKIDGALLLENIKDDAWEECGECSDGWLDSIKKHEIESLNKKLEKVFVEWLEESKNKPGFGKFECIHEYNLITGERVKGGR